MILQPLWKITINTAPLKQKVTLITNSRFVGLLKSPLGNITITVIINRLILLFIATLLVSFLEERAFDLLGNFKHMWLKWDSNHYLQIAEHGYRYEGNFKYQLVFYPMYPIMIRIMNFIIRDYFASAIIISMISLLISSITLYKLTLLELKDEVPAKNAVLLMLLYPLSFFATMAYTESSFLMFITLSFFFMRKSSWLRAGLFGFFAALTRNQGILLFAPMIFEIIRVTIEQKRSGTLPVPRKLILRFISPFFIILGFVAYLGLNKYVSGNWWNFLELQKTNWQQEFSFFVDNIVNFYLNIGDGHDRLSLGTWVPTAIISVAALIIIGLMPKALPTCYTLFSVIYFIITLSPSWLLSGGRYMMVLFPLYMVMAKLLVKRNTLNHLIQYGMGMFTLYVLLGFFKGVVY